MGTKIDRWKIYELSWEELKTIVNHASRHGEDDAEIDHCREDGVTDG